MKTEKPLTIHDFKKMKERKEPITMVTAYDYPTAKLVEEAELEMILVGDSLGMVVLGYDSTIPVTLQDMIHHTKAVVRGVKNVFVVADMPFLTYQISLEKTMENAGRLIQETGAKAVKMEGGQEIAFTVASLVKAGIPVVGHIGLTPQSVHQLGGYKVQGKSLEDAKRLLNDAKALEEAGIFALVLEAIPGDIARWISEQLSIPTIGIGAGNTCDGQVLVFHDLIQYASNLSPKFVKPYGQVGDLIRDSLMQYKIEVKSRAFPSKEHTFTMNEELLEQLYGKV